MRLSGRNSPSTLYTWRRPQRAVLLGLIAVNTAAFVLQLALEAAQPGMLRDYLGLSKSGIASAYGWQFLTAMFLHAGVLHFAANMLVLYLLGRDVETIIGQRHFLLIYICGAVAGELGHLFLLPTQTVLFGASGGVVAVLFAYGTILPELEFAPLALFPSAFRIKAKHLACATIAAAIVLLLLDRNGVVTHSVYLGACAAGWLYAHLRGFGAPSALQRFLRQRRHARERFAELSFEQFVAEEIDPLLDKISRAGMASLTRRERRLLARVREKASRSSGRP